MVLTGGAEWPRNLDVTGRDLDGIHYAMDFLTQQNKRGAGDDEAVAAPGGDDQRQGQACRRDRRRRYRVGLHRHLGAAGRGLDHPDRDHAEAAGEGEQGDGLAGLADQAAVLARA